MPTVFISPLWRFERAGHPESAARLAALEPLWSEQPVRELQAGPDIPEATALVHTPALIDAVEMACRESLDLDPDTPASPSTWRAVLAAQEAARLAVRSVAAGNCRRAFLPTRPPGHHATASRAMGFCLFNHIALAAELASQHADLSPVLIVDFDVHHGNGTEDIFYRRDDVYYFSMHQFPLFPGTGRAQETGAGPGEGWTRNLPLSPGTPREEQLRQFGAAMDEIERQVRPRLVLVSAGFDAHEADPLAGLRLRAEDFGALTRRLRALADRHAEGRILSFLEGGYDLAALRASVERHLAELDRAPGASDAASGGNCGAPAPGGPPDGA